MKGVPQTSSDRMLLTPGWEQRTHLLVGTVLRPASPPAVHTQHVSEKPQVGLPKTKAILLPSGPIKPRGKQPGAQGCAHNRLLCTCQSDQDQRGQQGKPQQKVTNVRAGMLGASEARSTLAGDPSYEPCGGRDGLTQKP